MSMTVIAHEELASDQASITFDVSGLTQYTDLYLVASVRSAATTTVAVPLRIELNASASGYSTRFLRGDGSSASSSTSTSSNGIYFGQVNADNFATNTYSSCSAYIPNFRSSEYKSISVDSVGENNATLAYQLLGAGLWSNTAAITDVTVILDSDNLKQYSSATLYGITAGSDGTTTVS